MSTASRSAWPAGQRYGVSAILAIVFDPHGIAGALGTVRVGHRSVIQIVRTKRGACAAAAIRSRGMACAAVPWNGTVP